MLDLITIITPTNSSKYLQQVYESILAQNYPRFEWVVLLNHTSYEHFVFPVGDVRVRPFQSKCSSTNIGALKKEACDLGTGNVMLELDHDDLLVPGTLAKIAEAYNAGAGFIYSDVAVFENDLTSWGYSPDFGWEHYPMTVYGQQFTVTRNFELSPRMLCEVYYAPDHVRCWSRKAYYAAGGHNPDLAVGDDHDLICRTYLSGAEFEHIGCCGYLYRSHEGNTVKARQAAIQAQQADNRRKYLLPLIAEWCKRNSHPVLDLIAEQKIGNWEPSNPSFVQRVSDRGRRQLGKNIYSDYPSTVNEYGHIVASDVLQCVEPDKLVDLFNRFYAALLPGGYLTVTVPSTAGRYADQSPLHKSRFNVNFFQHFARREFASQLPGVKCKFDIIQAEEFYPSDEHRKWDMKMLMVNMCALKGQRHPGPKLI